MTLVDLFIYTDGISDSQLMDAWMDGQWLTFSTRKVAADRYLTVKVLHIMVEIPAAKIQPSAPI